MASFPEKLYLARSKAKLTQKDLALACGITRRMIVSYENGDKKPRMNTLINLANALNVSIEYLNDDNCDDPTKNLENNKYIEQVYEKSGTKEAVNASKILFETAALMAGGELSIGEKEMFAQAMISMLEVCSAEAKRRYTPQKYKNEEEIPESEENAE